MRKRTAFFSLLSILLTGCTNSEPSGHNEDKEAPASYITITLLSPSGMTTRAPEDETDTQGPQYEVGNENENNVNSVRFFFFGASGAASPVKKLNGSEGYQSYIDWYPSPEDVEGPGDYPGTVEKILTATLGLNMPAADAVQARPSAVVAVLNPSQAVISVSATNAGNNVTGPSLEQLKNMVADFYTGLYNNNFVISNSVYINTQAQNNPIIYATPLEESNFATEIEDAIANPVQIYVERVLARLDFGVSVEPMFEGSNIYPTNPNNNNSYTVDGEPMEIFVKLLGWNITSTPNNSRLIKEIEDLSVWPVNLFGNNDPWNTADYHRSFWALNPPSDQFEYLFGIFSTEEEPEGGVGDNIYYADQYPIPASGSYSTIYMQENAGAYPTATSTLPEGPAQPTKVILAAQLVDSEGEPVSLAEWALHKYTLPELISFFANSYLNLYSKTTVNGQTTYTKIQPNQIELKSWFELTGQPSPDAETPNYYVYPVLTEEAENLTWTFGNDINAAVYTVDQVNAYMMDEIDHVMVWNTGFTYYYFDLRHLGALGSPAYWGVVRNHIYRAELTGLSGLGTPVYNPDEVIYPEETIGDDFLISAKVNILQWRVVSDEYNVNW